MQIRELWRFRSLFWQLTNRDVMSKYKGSFLGFAWSVLNPLLMLFVYSFIFIVVFRLKWHGAQTGGGALYTLMIFCGLIPFYVFSESINRSVGIISGNPNYVKKVLIPTELLPLSLVGSACVTNGIGLCLLIIGKMIFISPSIIALVWLPVLFVPLINFSIGFSLICASLGVYIKDMTHTVAITLNVLFYMSPIFYQVSAVPSPFSIIVHLNPLTSVISQWRRVILNGNLPQASAYLVSFGFSCLVLIAGALLFQRLRKGFADVI